MDVEFLNLSYDATIYHPLKSKTKKILKSVTGKFPSGKLTAVLGPSGSGKTSLLNAISGYRQSGVQGVLKVNDRVRDERNFRKSVCYITQDNNLEQFLSVNELMKFASNLKLSIKISSSEKQLIIDKILAELGLYEQKETRTECLSGGQKRRLSIALELINNPPIFFLDEPTTGLDYVAATYCLRLLQKLAREGHTVICTIHQPSAKMFQMFDHVYIVAEGFCIYQGAPQYLVPFLDSSQLPCPESYNPADYVIECIYNYENIQQLSKNIQNGKLSQTNALAPTGYNAHSINNNYVTENHNSIAETKAQSVADRNGCESCSYRPKLHYPVSYWHQFCVIFRKMFLQTLRNRTGLNFQLANYLSSLLCAGVLYFDKADDALEMFTHVKFCLGLVLFFVFTPIMLNVVNMPLEIPIVKKEIFNRWYSLKPYFVALTLSKIPIQVFLNTFLVLGLLLLGGFPMEPFRITVFFLIANLTFFVSDGIGLVVGSNFNIKYGCVVAPTLVGPLMFMEVYGLDFPHLLPAYVKSFLKLSYVRCSGLAIILIFFGYNRKPLRCTNIVDCMYTEPKILLRFLELQDESVWLELGYLLCFLLFFQLVAFICFQYRIKLK